MKYKEVLERIIDLDKSKIKIIEYKSKDYSTISLMYNDVRLFDITTTQFKKLKDLGYNTELKIY